MPRNNLLFYDQQAPQWWDEAATIFPLSRLNPLRFQYFDRTIPNWQGLTVLDVGCGGGYTCEFLARRGAIVTGIDQSVACIEVARTHAEANGLAIAYHAGVAESLPFNDQAFDVVVCVDVLEHVDGPATVVAEIGRVLKLGGWFCFDTINRTERSRWVMIWLLENILRQIPRGVHDWNKFLRPDELQQFLEQNHFSEIHIRGFDLFGRTAIAQLKTLVHFWKTGQFQVQFDDDTQIMYIGVARQPDLISSVSITDHG